MEQLAQPEGVADLTDYSGDGDASSLRSGVQEEDERLDCAFHPVLEPDREGVEAKYDRLPRLEQNSGPGRGGWHERPSTLGQNEDASVTACRLGLGLRLDP
jgi:hypothetical protein